MKDGVKDVHTRHFEEDYGGDGEKSVDVDYGLGGVSYAGL
jgi:hypothetical protein